MDQDLKALMASGFDEQEGTTHLGKKVTESELTILPKGEEIEIRGKDGPQRYRIKPMDELYGKDRGITSVQGTDDHYMPLLMGIEGMIADHYRRDRSLTDAKVLLALKALSMNPGAPCRNDMLCQAIQFGLRLTLSLNDYSKQETRQAIRKVAQSVERHTRLAGPRGYLEFIVDFV